MPPKKTYKKKLKGGKKYDFSKLRKFRVAVIAVYFSLLFPKYVNRFTVKRHKIHAGHYQEDIKAYNFCVPSFIDDLLHINMVDVSKSVRDEKLYNPTKFKGQAAKIMIS